MNVDIQTQCFDRMELVPLYQATNQWRYNLAVRLTLLQHKVRVREQPVLFSLMTGEEIDLRMEKVLSGITEV